MFLMLSFYPSANIFVFSGASKALITLIRSPVSGAEKIDFNVLFNISGGQVWLRNSSITSLINY
jgi:hypothetical protein